MTDPNAPQDPRRRSEPSWYSSPASGQGAPAPYGAGMGAPRGRMQGGVPEYAPLGYPGAPNTSVGLSLASMILGIVSLVGGFALLFPPIVGVVLGHMGLRRESNGRGLAIAGLVMNYLTLALTLGAVLLLALVILGIGAAGAGGPS